MFHKATDVFGKTPVYVDETDFEIFDFRRYANASKGMCVADKILGSHRYKTTILVASRIWKQIDSCIFIHAG